MAARAAHHHPFLHDLSRAFALLVGAACAAFLLIYVSYYWSPVSRANEAIPPANDANLATRYTGSIMVDPPRGELCWEKTFDNRTGVIWDHGYVKCDTEPAQVADASQRAGLNVWRMQEVGKAFRR